ncbi:MAG: hypothetical protein ABI980_06680 [Nitrospirota bacterium]
MHTRNKITGLYAGGRFALAACLFFAVAESGAESFDTRPVSRIEIVVADQYKNHLDSLKQEFAEAGLTNVHVQVARRGNPPTNIGLGSKVPADKAREVIRLALKYNQAVSILLPERLFPPRFVTIASSNFDDTVEYPILKEDLAHLLDTSLTTEQFHELYRRLTSVPLKSAGRY